MRGKVKWHIVVRLVQAVGAAVVGVAVDTAALDGQAAAAVQAVLQGLALLFGSS